MTLKRCPFFYWNVAGPPTSSFLFKIGVFINYFFLGLAVVRVYFLSLRLGSNLIMTVIFAVSYMFTEFAGCSVGRGISHGARKLTRIPT